MSKLVIDASTGAAEPRPLTREEADLRTAEEAAWEADRDRREGQAELEASERDLPRLARMLEDMLDDNPPHAKTLEWNANRKAARAKAFAK